QPLPPGFIDRAVRESLKLPAYVWRGLIAGMLAADSPVGLGPSRIPTLILWGDRDTVFPRGEQDALVKMIGTAELAVYPETGHALHWERPERFVRDLHAFMERTTSY
ncbi:MAG: alpha/beta fold hydrolase, partial [Gemmatimonadales bacterium]